MYNSVPNARATTTGLKTAEQYRLTTDGRAVQDMASQGNSVLRLPVRPRSAVPQISAVLHHGDGIEVVLIWTDPKMTREGFAHHVEFFRGSKGSAGRLLGEHKLIGGPSASISVFDPPDARDAATLLIDVAGGAYWGTTYVVSRDRHSIQPLFQSTDYEFADLDRDGAYELIAWNRRPFDLRCNFGIFAVRFYPEVFVRSGWQFRKVWPPATWAQADGELETHFRDGAANPRDDRRFQIVGGFADLDGDRHGELIVLEDQLREHPAQKLAVYRFRDQAFDLVVRTPLPSRYIAYLLSGVEDTAGGPTILVHFATPERCTTSSDPDKGKGVRRTPYLYRDGKLRSAYPSKAR
jgi:hypothetical protein